MAKTLNDLKEDAKRKCAAKGHKLAPWEDISPTRSFSECSRCHRWVSVSTHPDPIISGVATKLGCR